MSQPLLAVRHVAKRFGGVHALDDVSLAIGQGECLALMGGNGAGKSTLVSIVSGLAQADEGEVLFDSELVNFANPDAARKAGIETVYQGLALCDNLDAPGNLFLGRELTVGFGPLRFVRRKAMEQQTRATLADLDVTLPDLGAATIGFSGGQRQALAFARAVRASSRLLILDEPTAALGVGERARVLESIKRLRGERGMSVLLITHNLAEMRELADRVAVLRNGRLVDAVNIDDADDDLIVGLITGSRS